MTVHQARKLQATDWNITAQNSSDPFAMITLGPKQRARTAVVYQSLQPVWEVCDSGPG